jgi:creatinine amidohydrolase
VRGTTFEVAVLPWGATEVHNYHLPYGTDTIEIRHVAADAARRAWEAGARIVVLPAVAFGVQTGQLDLPLCLNLNPSTQLAMLRDLVQPLPQHGVRKLVILNAHGGNEFRGIIRELQPQVGVFLCVLNWWQCLNAREFFDQPGDHAGELETSVMQHIAGELVLPLSEAGDGAARPSRVRGLREGWAWAPRKWTEVTADTGVGDPARSTPEKGAAFLAAAAEKIAGFLVDLAAADPKQMYDDGSAGHRR